MRMERPSPRLIDTVLSHYLDWRQASAAVESAYGTWTRVGPDDRAAAFSDYCDALDLEERAAEAYRSSIDRAAGQGLGWG